MKDKSVVLDALDILNTISMEYEKFNTDCSHCKVFGIGNIQYSCNQPGYCPSFLSEENKNKLKDALS